MSAQVEELPLGTKVNVDQLGLSEKNDGPLRTCLSLSVQVFKGTIDGKLACLWGLIPPTILSNTAYLWMHTTKVIDDHQFVFIRHSQRILEALLDEYPLIVGHCHIDAERSIRWIKWLGGTFGAPDGKGIPFAIRKK